MHRPQTLSLPPVPTPVVMVRSSIAILLGVHGWFRLLTGGFIGFGQSLSLRGFPLGSQLALAITLFEIAGSLCLLFGRFVTPAAIGHSVILVSGIVLVHAPEGWFVVGGGRNGMEYSVLLLACLAAVVKADRERGNAGSP